MHVVMIGAGYVGLVSGACFAEFGANVTCVDVDARRIEGLEAGRIPIYEPGLDDLVARNVQGGRLKFSTDLGAVVPEADLVFIAVGTPSRRGDGHADLSYVYAAAREVAHSLRDYTVIVDKSTVPVGTAREVRRVIAAENPRADFDVASNPEFLREGAAITDFMRPDRVVIGVESPRAEALLRELYRPLNLIETPIVVTNLESAELVKYASNAFLATKISFINEMASLCETVGADVHSVARGMGLDGRIGRKFLHPGPGYGGSCFEADETVFVLNSPHVSGRSIRDVFSAAAPPVPMGVVEVVAPAQGRVLGFDLDSGTPRVVPVQALTRRPYKGTMVRIRTSMGRSLRVTADHPVVLCTDSGFETVLAKDVTPGDRLPALAELPAVEPVSDLDLSKLLRGTALEGDVYVAPTDQSFREQYATFAPHIHRDVLRWPEEIKRHNRMSLRLFHQLSDAGVLNVSADRLQLYTAKGAATRINALIRVDADLLRLCGYYLAEGWITREAGRKGAVRARIGFSFNEEEVDYIGDVRRILARLGMKYTERRGQHAVSTVVSSRVFAWLLEDVLKCGTCSEDASLPVIAFNVARELRFELLRGAFSGDGAVTSVQQGRNLMFEYATVSRRLADGMALLLQTLGIVPSVRPRWMSKSKQPAYLLRISGYAQIRAMRDLFGKKHRAKIDGILDGYQRQIRQRGFERRGSHVALTVRDVSHEEVETEVYSMETGTGTLIGASGLICHNCFPKDTLALVRTAQEHNVPCRIVEAVVEVNAAQRARMVRKIRDALGGSEAGKTLAVLGLTFKPETDDMRDSPALAILPALIEKGAVIRANDPQGIEEARKLLPETVTYTKDVYEALDGADAAILLTEWNEYRGLDLDEVQARMRGKVFIDLRNVYEPKRMHEAGFEYVCVGRHVH